MKRLKIFPGLIIMGGFEFLTYIFFKPNNFEYFFLIWSFISLFFLLHTVFSVDGRYLSCMMQIGNRNQYPHMASEAAKRMYEKTGVLKILPGGLKDPANLIYLLFFIFNVICYIIVMPK